MGKPTFDQYGAAWWADACLKGGDGQCDGFIDEGEHGSGNECACPCHTDFRPWGLTVTEVHESHKTFWKRA